MKLPKVRVASSSFSVTTNTTVIVSSIHLMILSAILVAILVIAIIAPMQAQPLIPGGNRHNLEFKHYCKNSLSDVIRLLCDGYFSSQPYVQYPNNSDAFDLSTLRHVSSNDETLYFKTIQIERIHECCLRPCGYLELKTFCVPT